MAPSADYVEFVLEHLKPIGTVRTTRFFGGVGVYLGSVQFAMMMGNTLYFVVDDATRKKYEQAGMQAFSYAMKKGQVQVRRYFELPEDILTDAQQLRFWARESIEVASRKQAAGRSARKSAGA